MFREVLLTALVALHAVHLVPLVCSLDCTPPLQDREQADQAVAEVSWLGRSSTAEDTSNWNIGQFRLSDFFDAFDLLKVLFIMDLKGNPCNIS